MKKYITLLLLALAVDFGAKAQSCNALSHHYMGHYSISPRNVMELHDENIVTCVQMYLITNDWQYIGDYGYRFLKISREDATVMDSVMIYDEHMITHPFLEPSPVADDFLFVTLQYDDSLGNCYLDIRHFDDDLAFDESAEVRTLLEGQNIYEGRFALDGEDLIVYYSTREAAGNFHPDSIVVSRFGLDGT